MKSEPNNIATFTALGKNMPLAAPHLCTFLFPTVNITNMTAVRTIEVETTPTTVDVKVK
jgi:hypothetical protein